MRTATLFLLFGIVPTFAGPQDRAVPKPDSSQEKPAATAAQAPRFEAIPATVVTGQATQLTWTVDGATSVNIQPVVGSVPASGSAPVTPSETTTYTLTAVLPSGNVQATAIVTVTPAGTPTQAGDEGVKTPATAPAAPATVPASMPVAERTTVRLPAAPPAAADIDPGKLAAPRDATNKAAGVRVDYRAFILGAEDQIGISVYGSPEFSGTHMIRPDGKITLNFIGEVMAAELTPEQLGNEIKDRIKKYIVDPDVSVSVLAVKSKKYFIQGEVGRTGEFPLTVPTRVLEALVNAGGFKDFANKKNIIIMRGSNDAQTTERIKFNYNEVIKGKHLEQNIYLKPGDIILVR